MRFGDPLKVGDRMVMGVYSRETKAVLTEYALVNKGPNSLSDWLNNIQQMTTGTSTDGWDSLEKAKQFINDYPDDEITFIGHSKGGAEAAINAVATNKNAIIFNPSVPDFSKYDLNTRLCEN